MFTEERQNAIEKCLREKGKVRVKELSEMFQVTEDCIRKDLKILENAGRLKRTYGGAILSQEYDGHEVPISNAWMHSDYPDIAFVDLGPDPVLPDPVDYVLEVEMAE